MGQRSSTETIVAIVHAFLERRTWPQTELARRLEVGVPALRKKLVEMQSSGFPLDREEDHPHVYWSVPKDWFPGGVVFQGQDAKDLFRQLVRLRKSKTRDRLLGKLILPGPHETAMRGLADDVVVANAIPAEEERNLSVVEDAALKKTALRMRYYSASRGADSRRHASVHRVFYGTPARFVATCHKDGSLKWFRVENIIDASLDPDTAFRPAAEEALRSFEAESLEGFHGIRPAMTVRFSVREPEARWVAKNLLSGMRAESTSSGLDVSITTSALGQVARFVVSLGGAAMALSPDLASEVAALAEGALESTRVNAKAPRRL